MTIHTQGFHTVRSPPPLPLPLPPLLPPPPLCCCWQFATVMAGFDWSRLELTQRGETTALMFSLSLSQTYGCVHSHSGARGMLQNLSGITTHIVLVASSNLCMWRHVLCVLHPCRTNSWRCNRVWSLNDSCVASLRASLYLVTVLQKILLMLLCTHSCACYILSTKIHLPLTQWGHFWEARRFSLVLTTLKDCLRVKTG